jgi:hypothetical protein
MGDILFLAEPLPQDSALTFFYTTFSPSFALALTSPTPFSFRQSPRGGRLCGEESPA